MRHVFFIAVFSFVIFLAKNGLAQESTVSDPYGLMSSDSRLLVMVVSLPKDVNGDDSELHPLSETETIQISEHIAKWGIQLVPSQKVIQFKKDFPSAGMIKLAREEKASHILTAYTGHRRIRQNDTSPVHYENWITYALIDMTAETPKEVANDRVSTRAPLHPGVDILGFDEFIAAENKKTIDQCGMSLRIYRSKPIENSLRPIDSVDNP